MIDANTTIVAGFAALLDRQPYDGNFAADLKQHLQNVWNKTPRKLIDFVNDFALPGNVANQDFHSYDIPAGTLRSNGDEIEFETVLLIDQLYTNVNASLRFSFNGTILTGQPMQGTSTNGYYVFRLIILRVDNATVKFIFSSDQSTNPQPQFSTQVITGLDLLANPYTVKGVALMGTNGFGTTNGTIKRSVIKYIPAA